MSEQTDKDVGSGRRAWRWQDLPKNGLAKTLLIPLLVSFFSAVLVSSATITLRPQYQLNQERNRQQNILAAANLWEAGGDVAKSFEQVEPRVVDLTTGTYAADVDPEALQNSQRQRGASDSVPIPRELDIALIRSRSRYAVVYHVSSGDRLSMIILPVYGYGLWSTMYGYIALEADANTIVGLRFYQHGETPGLGGEIDNPKWQRLWQGKKLYGDAAEPLIEVMKGTVSSTANPYEDYQVDGISGATLTGRGVTNLLRYWLGPHGFGPYLQRLRTPSETAA